MDTCRSGTKRLQAEAGVREEKNLRKQDKQEIIPGQTPTLSEIKIRKVPKKVRASTVCRWFICTLSALKTYLYLLKENITFMVHLGNLIHKEQQCPSPLSLYF